MTVKNSKIGVLIINLGTPDSPSVPDVRKYLREFLMDARVINKHIFQSLGGKRWQLVESLNISPTWIECLKQLVLEKS